MPFEAAEAGKRGIRKELETFQGCPFWHKFIQGRKEQPLVLLGHDDRFTIWTIIDVEAMSTGEDLVTMKARSSLSVLPNVDLEKVPDAFRAHVDESLNAFVDEVHRSAPISVIDRARDAAGQILLAHFELTGKDTRDLGALIKRLEGESLAIAASSAKIIARLHARAKPVERQKRSLRAIREQDAELAAQCVGTILCELGWGQWA